ncbi:MAG TPA: tetratricopeptide repeat protein, partial [Firmicutes bacterium]|nr:tetratricopeptide repeat protein [Bacillota bacterium]
MDKRLAVQENEKKKRVARLLSRAAGHLARGNHRYAARALYQALDADPQNAEIRRQLSEVLLDACEDWMVGGALGWEWTEKRLRSVIEPLQPMLRSGQDVDTLKLLARIYERFRRLDDAMEALRKALAAGGSRDPEVHALLGRLHMQRGNLDRARYSFERSLSLQPRYAPGMVGLAALEMQKGEARAALLHLRGAVAADPRCTEAYCRLGELYLYRFGNVKRASLMARQALLLDPHDPMARHLLGMVRYVSGDVEGAVAEWQKTVSGLNAYGPSLHTLADVSLEKEDYGGARGYLERLLFAYPEDPEAKVKLGLASAALGDYFGASRLWEEARRQSQDDGYSRVFLADLYASLDRWDETWELLGEALSLELPPELDEQLRDLLLEAYAHCTLYEQAAYTVDKALQRYPDDPAILLAAALL